MGDTRLDSVCVFCGSSDAAAPALLASAADLGRILAREGLGLIYGGGGVGLMGACAKAAHEAGGQVLGIIPHFLKERERRLVRSLTPSERAALRRDMAEASAWMRAELKRRKSS